ncbi:SERAC1 protein [Colletotrichum simmondsii]|uniref:SERAC1 protein n=1 Tax=Colletotrichum simmondsii TaxID=703756 RepID=A0A135RSA8_9PEZI|nr:SERAC1 protein [Colletotrichum simmondsii]
MNTPDSSSRASSFESIGSDGQGLFLVAAGGPSPICDVVFVHGLSGHSRKTWTWKPEKPPPIQRAMASLRNKDNTSHNMPDKECFWPDDLLAKDFETVRVFTFGPYEQALFSAANLWPATIAFIAHSLGGLLVKAVMDDFATLLDEGLRITTYREQKGCYKLRGLDDPIVDSRGSIIGHRNENRVPIHEDHRSMCKFGFTGSTRITYDQLVKPEVGKYLTMLRSVTVLDMDDVEEDDTKKKELLKSAEFDADLERISKTMLDRGRQIEDAYSHTLAWLIQPVPRGPGLIEWLRSGRDIFWIQGLPGSGKSTVMKSLVQKSHIGDFVAEALHLSGCLKASMFLTDRVDDAHRSWEGVLAAMVFWLKKLFPPLASTIDAVVVNALDEMDYEITPRHFMVDFLKQLAAESQTGKGLIKICAASRPENEIEVEFQRLEGFRMQKWTLDDITNFVNGKLRSHPDAIRHDRLAQYDTWLNDVCEEIIGSSQGVFLWVRLVVEDVYHSQTNGEPLVSIRDRLQRLPKKNLPEFFMHILRKTPQETRHETYGVLQTLLRTRQAVSVLSMGIMLKLISSRHPPNDPNIISSSYLSEIEGDGDKVERRLRRCTGGLVQAVPPSALGGFDPYISTSSEYHPALQPSRLHIDQKVNAARWEVQFLHQTVKEFLDSPIYQHQINQIILSWATGSENPIDDGHILNLRLVDAYLSLEPTAFEDSNWTIDPMETMMQHAPATEDFKGYSSTPLLVRIDKHLSRDETVQWGVNDETWKTTFLAFAAGHRMYRFVQEVLDKGYYQIHKPGRPLLHYTGWFPGSFPDRRMAEILFSFGADVNETFDEPINGYYRTAVESLRYDMTESLGQSYLDYIELVLHRKGELSRPIYDGTLDVFAYRPRSYHTTRHRLQRTLHKITSGRQPVAEPSVSARRWTTVLHHVADMPVDGSRKLAIFKNIPKGDKLNCKRWDGQTVFELFMRYLMEYESSQPACQVSATDILDLLNRGARITEQLVELMYLPAVSPQRTGLSMSIIQPSAFAESAFYLNREAWKTYQKLKGKTQNTSGLWFTR